MAEIVILLAIKKIGTAFANGADQASTLFAKYRKQILELQGSMGRVLRSFDLFSEDYCFKRKQLIRLWTAEGFIEERGESTLEEVAEGCLKELIDRNMLQLVKRNSFEFTRAYNGEQLAFLTGWFPKLKILYLIDLPNLNRLEIQQGAMASLERLYLVNLSGLMEVPPGIEFLMPLQFLGFFEITNNFFWLLDQCSAVQGTQWRYTLRD
ncbi:hypothetical protein ZWY2020_005495 [Hordeum vulgare]|nr:hypothetical protein ZWY2020_005495 [Hordeum vulgare]